MVAASKVFMGYRGSRRFLKTEGSLGSKDSVGDLSRVEKVSKDRPGGQRILWGSIEGREVF